MQHKPRAVLDSSVVVSAIGWRGEVRQVLRLLAAGGFESCRTPWLTTEWAETVQRVALEEPLWRNPNWANWLLWLKAASGQIAEVPTRKTVRRDPEDDPVVMAAVAAGAQYNVTTDKDLPDLRKPYGISSVTPRSFMNASLTRSFAPPPPHSHAN